MVDIFPSSLSFHWEPGPATQFAGARENESVGHKTNMWDPLFKNYEAFQDRESRGGVPSECGALWTVEVTGQQSQLWVTGTHTLRMPRL